MATFKLNLLVLMSLVLTCIQFHSTTAQTTHTVGGNLGWIIPTGPSDYTTWASAQSFTVGDTLLFNFATGAHTVAEVAQAAYAPCTSTNPIALVSTGPARLTLNAPGTHYYICTVGTHCQAGQKLTINVSAASPTPSPVSPPRNQKPETSPPTSGPSSSDGTTPSPTGSTILPPPSPNGVARSFTAVVPFTFLAIALGFFY